MADDPIAGMLADDNWRMEVESRFWRIIYVTKQALGATESSGRPALQTEIEITPEMRRLGAYALDDARESRSLSDEEAAVAIYKAMEAARRARPA